MNGPVIISKGSFFKLHRCGISLVCLTYTTLLMSLVFVIQQEGTCLPNFFVNWKLLRKFDNFTHLKSCPLVPSCWCVCSVIFLILSHLIFFFFSKYISHAYLALCLCHSLALSFRPLMLTKSWNNTSLVALPNHQCPGFRQLHQLQIKIILLDMITFCHQSCVWTAAMVARYWSDIFYYFMNHPYLYVKSIYLILKLDAVRALPWSSKSLAGIEG